MRVRERGIHQKSYQCREYVSHFHPPIPHAQNRMNYRNSACRSHRFIAIYQSLRLATRHIHDLVVIELCRTRSTQQTVCSIPSPLVPVAWPVNQTCISTCCLQYISVQITGGDQLPVPWQSATADSPASSTVNSFISLTVIRFSPSGVRCVNSRRTRCERSDESLLRLTLVSRSSRRPSSDFEDFGGLLSLY